MASLAEHSERWARDPKHAPVMVKSRALMVLKGDSVGDILVYGWPEEIIEPFKPTEAATWPARVTMP